MADRKRHIGRRILLTLVVLAVIGVTAYGWMYSRDVDLAEVRYSGIVLADSASVVERAAVPDSVKLFNINLADIADRVSEEPWVQSVSVSRTVRGILTIAIEERTPVVLALTPDGRPAAFLDEIGRILPATPAARIHGFNVPLLTGSLPTLIPGDTLSSPMMQDLLAALASASPDVDALISGIKHHRDGRLTLHTAPGPHGQALSVALGRDDFPRKLEQLAAFWEQAVLTDPYSSIQQIDLRYHGIIVAAGID